MSNEEPIAKGLLLPELGDSRYHLRLLGVLAALVDRDTWRDALRIADLLAEEARTGSESSGKIANAFLEALQRPLQQEQGSKVQ